MSRPPPRKACEVAGTLQECQAKQSGSLSNATFLSMAGKGSPWALPQAGLLATLSTLQLYTGIGNFFLSAVSIISRVCHVSKLPLMVVE